MISHNAAVARKMLREACQALYAPDMWLRRANTGRYCAFDTGTAPNMIRLDCRLNERTGEWQGKIRGSRKVLDARIGERVFYGSNPRDVLFEAEITTHPAASIASLNPFQMSVLHGRTTYVWSEWQLGLQLGFLVRIMGNEKRNGWVLQCDGNRLTPPCDRPQMAASMFLRGLEAKNV